MSSADVPLFFEGLLDRKRRLGGSVLAPVHEMVGEAVARAQLAVAAGLIYVPALKPGAIGPNPDGSDPPLIPVPQPS